MRTTYEPLTQSFRDLIDAAIRSPTDAATVAAPRVGIDSATTRLRSSQLQGAFGARRITDGGLLAWGNAATGIRNPLAPPLEINRDPSGRLWTEVHLGAAYEGPPGHARRHGRADTGPPSRRSPLTLLGLPPGLTVDRIEFCGQNVSEAGLVATRRSGGRAPATA
jgi:hypothetical protein